ncbi:MAG: 16S rRNA (guanine(966)-N(2))-methyltransferase RsmD [Lachnospiraceae bacterium]|nr:16S rRNA (guanine(966)-N(2))-methyltransferase RsmD [Lachnospiraceae bacterium]
MRVIAGTARSLKLTAPKGLEVRPTTDRIKETLFNILSPDIYDAVFLDLFCGSGAIGIEALSRGASECVFVDNSPASLDCTRANLEHTRLDGRAHVIRGEAAGVISRLAAEKKYDVVFMDPPYGKQLEKQVLEQMAVHDILSGDGIVIVEADTATEFDYLPELGFEAYRVKSYGSNKHVFIRKDGGRY